MKSLYETIFDTTATPEDFGCEPGSVRTIWDAIIYYLGPVHGQELSKDLSIISHNLNLNPSYKLRKIERDMWKNKQLTKFIKNYLFLIGADGDGKIWFIIADAQISNQKGTKTLTTPSGIGVNKSQSEAYRMSDDDLNRILSNIKFTYDIGRGISGMQYWDRKRLKDIFYIPESERRNLVEYVKKIKNLPK